jgi:hypothetical protein
LFPQHRGHQGTAAAGSGKIDGESAFQEVIRRVAGSGESRGMKCGIPLRGERVDVESPGDEFLESGHIIAAAGAQKVGGGQFVSGLAEIGFHGFCRLPAGDRRNQA